jgi:hypothetical protein
MPGLVMLALRQHINTQERILHLVQLGLPDLEVELQTLLPFFVVMDLGRHLLEGVVDQQV